MHRMDLTKEELQAYLQSCSNEKLVDICREGRKFLTTGKLFESVLPLENLDDLFSVDMCIRMIEKIREIKSISYPNTTNSNADFFLDLFRKEDVEKNEKERIEIESKFVLKRFMHCESDSMRERLSDADVPEEYGIELRKDLLGGLMIWGKYNGVWSQHPSNCAPLVMCLLLEANLLNK